MNESQWTIGADPSSDLWINDPDVSRNHCRLIRSTGGYQVSDSGSTNGTFCNGERIDSATVSPADNITLSGHVPMPWPDPELSPQVISIGFDADCDYRINDRSVSGRHAELFVDPNGQWIVRDLDSTNGTWIGQESIHAAVIETTDQFRIGMVAITPRQIIRKVGGDSTSSWPPMTPSRIAAIASTTAVLCLLGLFLVLRGRSEPADVDASDAVAIVDPNPVADDQESIAEPTTDEHASTVAQPLEIERPGPVSPASNATSEPPLVTDLERVIGSLFVIVHRRGKSLVSIATAWAVSPSLLVTNGHVVESIEQRDYKVTAVHLASGAECSVSEFGYHPKYLENQKQLAQLVSEIQQLQQNQTGAAKSESSEGIRLVQQGNRRASQVAQRLDTFDAGWLRIDNSGVDVVPVNLKTVPVEPRKALRLATSFLEKESAIFVQNDRFEPGFLPLRASHEPIVHQDKSTPVRWSGQFRSAPDQWSDYHFDGCPVVSLRGQLVGMSCGFSRKIISNNPQSANDNRLIDTVELVPFQVIQQMVQNLTKRENQ